MRGMSDDYEPDRHITEAEYRAWLEHCIPQLAAELTDLLPQEARDAGTRFEWKEIPDNGILTYDYVPPKLPDAPWTPMRNIFSRWHSGKVCYALPSGNMVHVKPGCRC